MSKIIKNGVTYGGMPTVSGNISYDNTSSGLNAITVQNAITELKEIYDLPKGYAWAGTQDEWDALSASEKAVYDGKIIAIIGDDSIPADNVIYDNTDSGLTSDNVQNAITELKGLADNATTQMTALPVASAANVNKIYQYTGATNANYINGMFYKCVYDTNVNPAVYKWQIIDTSTSSADEVTYNNTNSGLAAANVQAAIDELNTNDVGKKEYVNGVLKGEIFNSYNQHDVGVVTVYKNQASGTDSHAEGGSTTASGYFSHAEGYGNTASGVYSHTEGSANTSSGHSSHTEGMDNKAKGDYSHAGGNGTIANTKASTVIGKYNVADGTGSSDPKHLFIVGNGTANNNRSNVMEVSDSYLNVNGDIKKNGVALGSLAMKDVDGIHREMSDVEYEALPAAKKNDGTEYFVYETGDDNRSIICKDAQGNFKYEGFIHGVVRNGTPGWSSYATDPDCPTTPPEKADPTMYTTLNMGLRTSEKTVYFGAWAGHSPSAYERASDKDASNFYFILTGNPNAPYSVTNGTETFGGNFVETLTTDIVTLGTKPTGNRYIKAYDKSYGDMSDLGDLAYKDTASGTAVTTVGTLPSLTYDSTTESFTFSAGTLPTTGTVTVS